MPTPKRAVEIELEEQGLESVARYLREHSLVDEFSRALKADVHEGLIQPYGFVYTASASSLQVMPGHTYVNASTIAIETGRAVADGVTAFAVFDSGGYAGVVRANSALGERGYHALARSAQGIVARRDSSGSAHVYDGSAILIHTNRKWHRREAVSRVLRRVVRCSPTVDTTLLRAILEFANFELAPASIGATLVLDLTATEPVLAGCVPRVRLPAALCNFSTGEGLDTLRHLLRYHDGAAIVGSNGAVVGLEAHLLVSDKATTLIPGYSGTRHTSSRRYSYDEPRVVVVTVSADGPVSVFSDGAKVGSIDVLDAQRLADGLQMAVPAKEDDVLASDGETMVCPTCGKTLEVDCVVVTGWKERESACCPACECEVISRMCFSIDAHLLKAL